MPKNKTIYSFFKRIETNDNDTTQPTSPIEIEQTHVEVENEEDTLNHGDGVEVETENMESPTPTRPSPAKIHGTFLKGINGLISSPVYKRGQGFAISNGCFTPIFLYRNNGALLILFRGFMIGAVVGVSRGRCGNP
ncbi:hypothetical protein ACFE04_011095 [Oxalis oulophora]